VRIMNPVQLRGHHLNVARDAIVLGNEYLWRLIRWGYVSNHCNSFIPAVFGRLPELFSEETNLIKLVAGTPDFICDACPLKDKGAPECLDQIPFENPSLPHSGGILFGLKSDSDAAREYGFVIGETYSVRKIRRKMKF